MGLVRYLVGTGSHGLRPPGYKTIDIDPANEPDIVADAASLPGIASESADEFYASHVLEHFSWPRALQEEAGLIGEGPAPGKFTGEQGAENRSR